MTSLLAAVAFTAAQSAPAAPVDHSQHTAAQHAQHMQQQQHQRGDHECCKQVDGKMVCTMMKGHAPSITGMAVTATTRAIRATPTNRTGAVRAGAPLYFRNLKPARLQGARNQ